MTCPQNKWIVILAGGDGLRLSAVTTNRKGAVVPKQFCSFRSKRSLLQRTIRRMEAVVPREQILVVVAKQHETWWKKDLAGFLPQNIIVQPKNCGTAVGILLSLLHPALHDPETLVAIVPSDHYIRDESIVCNSLQNVFASQNILKDKIVLLGLEADSADIGYGWIVPDVECVGPFKKVHSFVEKPSLDEARLLLTKKALWNSFIFASSIGTFLKIYSIAHPTLLETFSCCRPLTTTDSGAALDALYTRLPSVDFSRDILEKVIAELLVLGLPACGWSDLGTPERLKLVLQQNQDSPLVSTTPLLELPLS